MQFTVFPSGLRWASLQPEPGSAGPSVPHRWHRLAFRDPFQKYWKGRLPELALHLAILLEQNRFIESFDYRFVVEVQVADFLAGAEEGLPQPIPLAS